MEWASAAWSKRFSGSRQGRKPLHVAVWASRYARCRSVRHKDPLSLGREDGEELVVEDQVGQKQKYRAGDFFQVHNASQDIIDAIERILGPCLLIATNPSPELVEGETVRGNDIQARSWPTPQLQYPSIT